MVVEIGFLHDSGERNNEPAIAALSLKLIKLLGKQMSKRVGKTQLLTGLPTLVRKKKSSKDEDLCETCTSVDSEKVLFADILSN